MSTDDFQQRIQRIQKVSEPKHALADGPQSHGQPLVEPTAGPARNLPVNRILGGSLAFCLIAAIGIVAVFGMGSFRSGEDVAAEAPKPVVRRMN